MLGKRVSAGLTTLTYSPPPTSKEQVTSFPTPASVSSAASEVAEEQAEQEEEGEQLLAPWELPRHNTPSLYQRKYGRHRPSQQGQEVEQKEEKEDKAEMTSLLLSPPSVFRRSLLPPTLLSLSEEEEEEEGQQPKSAFLPSKRTPFLAAASLTHKRIKLEHSPASGSEVAAAAAASSTSAAVAPVSPSSLLSAAPASSSPPPSPSKVQSRIDLHFDEDYSRRRSLPAHKLQVRRQRAATGVDMLCPHCHMLLLDVTVKDHAKVCKEKLPPPVRLALDQSALNRWVVVQAASTYNPSLWSGGVLLRVSYAEYNMAKGQELKKWQRTLKWLWSILHSREGRDLDEDIEGGLAKELEEDQSEWALQPDQELWVYRLKESVAAAAVVNTALHKCTLTHNTIPTKITTTRTKSITSYFRKAGVAKAAASAPAASSSPAAAPVRTSSNASITSSSSAASSAASSSSPLPPLFGIDKIAVHAKYRFASQRGKASAAASSSSSTSSSLACHLLHSLLGYYSHSFRVAATPSRVAFSETTDAGRKLAVRFTGTERFATYTLPVGLSTTSHLNAAAEEEEG